VYHGGQRHIHTHMRFLWESALYFWTVAKEILIEQIVIKDKRQTQ
jgi:hypothetical protein